MPLYMDIHTVDSETFTVEDVVKAHMQDLAIQERFGVTQIKYWVNVEAKTLFCLMDGPNKKACNMVHKESHGNTACNIIEVSDDEFNLFLGEGKSENDLAHTNHGELDTGYRTILLINAVDLNGKHGNIYREIHRSIKEHQGTVIIQPEEEIMVSFIFSSQAIDCASGLYKYLKSASDDIEFTLALVSGRPVDEQGENLFEESKRKVRCLCELGLMNTVYIDSATLALYEKERISQNKIPGTFHVIHSADFLFLHKLYDILNARLSDPEFKSEDLYTLLRLSKSQAYRQIKSHIGLAPNQLIHELRLRNSLKILKNNKQTISETAFDSGFNSPPYFAKAFKKRFKITPTSFIKIPN
ncbi:MAG: DUF4242 domain-containing protein [Calditrichaeota bacterium]|nr:MAG: DUF4242 domain-containing protein [Calditrichota bacterium]